MGRGHEQARVIGKRGFAFFNDKVNSLWNCILLPLAHLGQIHAVDRGHQVQTRIIIDLGEAFIRGEILGGLQGRLRAIDIIAHIASGNLMPSEEGLAILEKSLKFRNLR